MSSVSIRTNICRPRLLTAFAALAMVTAMQPAVAKKAPQAPYLPVEHVVSGNQAQIFQATIAALEDNGFIISSVDSNSGFIRATSPIRDTRDFFENLTGEAEYKSTAATVTMIPNSMGTYTVRLRLIRSRTESQSGFGEFAQSGEQKSEKIDQSVSNYTRIFSLIDARIAGLKTTAASVETASAR